MVNVNADTVSVLLGGGDGGFGAKTDFATGGKTLQPMGDSPARQDQLQSAVKKAW